MKKLIRKILKEHTSERLTPFEIKLFKFLNKKQIDQNSVSMYLKQHLPLLGVSAEQSLYYTLLYKLNYREDGKYELISSAKNFYDAKPKKISRNEFRAYTSLKIPYKGSNIKSEWRFDSNGIPYYVVTSYGWYPVFLFKEDKWYEVDNSYSRTTQRQMSKANPTMYNSKIGQHVVMVSSSEMENLKYEMTYDKLMKNKQDSFLSSKSSIINGVRSTNIDYNKGKVTYQVNDVKQQDNKIILDISVLDVKKKEGRKSLPLDFDYKSDSDRTFSKKNIELSIYNSIEGSYRTLLNGRHVSAGYGDESIPDIPDDLIFKIVFHHK